MIGTRTHAIIDYVVAAVRLAAPYLLGFATGGPAQTVPMFAGAAILVYSLLTRYEYAAMRVIPFRVHLVLDVLVAAGLIASPWVFGFADQIWWPHVVVGALALLVTAASWSAREPAV